MITVFYHLSSPIKLIFSINALKNVSDEEETSRSRRSVEDAILAYNSELKLEFKEKHRTKIRIPVQNKNLKDLQILTSLQTYVLVSRKEVMKVKVADMGKNCSMLEDKVEHWNLDLTVYYCFTLIKDNYRKRV